MTNISYLWPFFTDLNPKKHFKHLYSKIVYILTHIFSYMRFALNSTTTTWHQAA